MGSEETDGAETQVFFTYSSGDTMVPVSFPFYHDLRYYSREDIEHDKYSTTKLCNQPRQGKEKDAISAEERGNSLNADPRPAPPSRRSSIIARGLDLGDPCLSTSTTMTSLPTPGTPGAVGSAPAPTSHRYPATNSGYSTFEDFGGRHLESDLLQANKRKFAPNYLPAEVHSFKQKLPLGNPRLSRDNILGEMESPDQVPRWAAAVSKEIPVHIPRSPAVSRVSFLEAPEFSESVSYHDNLAEYESKDLGFKKETAQLKMSSSLASPFSSFHPSASKLQTHSGREESTHAFYSSDHLDQYKEPNNSSYAQQLEIQSEMLRTLTNLGEEVRNCTNRFQEIKTRLYKVESSIDRKPNISNSYLKNTEDLYPDFDEEQRPEELVLRVADLNLQARDLDHDNYSLRSMGKKGSDLRRLSVVLDRASRKEEEEAEESVFVPPALRFLGFKRSADDGYDGIGFCGWVLTAVSWAIVLVTLPFSLCVCFKVVQEYERAVIFRLGRLLAGGSKGPGIFFVLPCIETYQKVDLRTITLDVPPQEVLTRDSVTVSVDAVVYYRVSNATISVANVENAHHSTRLLAQTTLRNILGTKNLHEILSDRESISGNMQIVLDEATEPWGIKVERVEIKDCRLPVQLQRAMAAEAEAAREARAKVIAADGEQKAASALRDAADVMSQSSSALQLRYLQTLSSISSERNHTIVFPFPIELARRLFKAD